MMRDSYTPAERAADTAYHAWLDLTANDPKHRPPDVYLREGRAYVAAHPDDLRTARQISTFAAAEAQRWAAFEAALNIVHQEIEACQEPDNVAKPTNVPSPSASLAGGSALRASQPAMW